jgi:hypothetical protein
MLEAMTFEVRAEYFQVIVLDEESRYDFSDAWTDAASEQRIAQFPGGLLLGTATDGVVAVSVELRADAPEWPEDQMFDAVAMAGLECTSGRLLVLGPGDDDDDAHRIDVPPGEYGVLARFLDAAAPPRCELVLSPWEGAVAELQPIRHGFDAVALEDARGRIEERLAATWPDHEVEAFVWELGPARARLPHFRVLRVAPPDPAGVWRYVTAGAWVVGGVEFFLESPREEALHVELLAMLANHHTRVEGGLSAGATVAIGRPWLEGAAEDRLCLAAADPSVWAPVETASGRIEFLMAVPCGGGDGQAAPPD